MAASVSDCATALRIVTAHNGVCRDALGAVCSARDRGYAPRCGGHTWTRSECNSRESYAGENGSCAGCPTPLRSASACTRSESCSRRRRHTGGLRPSGAPAWPVVTSQLATLHRCGDRGLRLGEQIRRTEHDELGRFGPRQRRSPGRRRHLFVRPWPLNAPSQLHVVRDNVRRAKELIMGRTPHAPITARHQSGARPPRRALVECHLMGTARAQGQRSRRQPEDRATCAAVSGSIRRRREVAG